jgi:hypothetical protein
VVILIIARNRGIWRWDIKILVILLIPSPVALATFRLFPKEVSLRWIPSEPIRLRQEIKLLIVSSFAFEVALSIPTLSSLELPLVLAAFLLLLSLTNESLLAPNKHPS